MLNFVMEMLLHFPHKCGDAIMKFLYGKRMGTSKELRIYYRKKYKVDIGQYSYGGCFDSSFNQGGSVAIGRYCSIANNVHYFGANHPLNTVSTSAYFYNKTLSGQDVKDVSRNKLTIGNDVWIGYGTIITCGCKSIGTGSVIGAGSVVTHDIPENVIAAGNPAKVIRCRHTKEQFEQLYKTQWWDKEFEYIMQFYDHMDNIEVFCKKILQEKEKRHE